MRLQRKILLAILPTVILCIAGLGFWADNQATTSALDTVDKYLHGVLRAYVSQTLEPQQALLTEHGLDSTPSFVASYQADVAPLVDRIALPWRGHVFILDGSGGVVECPLDMEGPHADDGWGPVLSFMIDNDLEQLNGEKVVNGRRAHYRIERYRPWKWFVIAFADMEDITGAAADIRFGSLLAALACAVVIILVMTYLSKRFVVAPIASLSQAARAMATHGTVPAIPVHSRDELGQLAHDLEETLKIIEDGRQQLQEWNRTLEHQVAERTSDLERANERLLREIEQRRDTETKLRLAQRMASLGYWEFDHSTDTLTWSEEVFTIFALSPKSPPPSYDGFLDRVHPDDRDRVARAYDEALRGKWKYDISHRIVRPGGEVRHVHQHCIIRCSDHGAPIRSQGSIQDITETKRNEYELAAALKKFRDFVEGTDNLVTQVDANGVFTYLNHTARAIYGLNPSEMIGKTAFDFIHPDDRDTTQQAFMGWVGRKAKHATFNNRQVGADGAVTQLLWSIHFEYDPDGRLLAVNSIARDVTREKAAQQKLKNYALRLARSNTEIKSFAYIVSHDLRAPLVNLKGFAAELAISVKDLLRVMAPALPGLDDNDRETARLALEEDIPEALAFIQQSTKRMDTLINQILALSRLGRRELTIEELDVGEVVDSVLASLSHQIEKHGITIDRGPMPAIQSDRAALDQIFSNLLTNSIKYRSPDRPPHIRITSHEEETEHVFSIEDNGMGIAPENMDRVFEPFRRAAPSEIPGEGMGLAYVQTLLRRLNGRIWCDSTPGQGSVFQFTIAPAIEEEDDHEQFQR